MSGTEGTSGATTGTGAREEGCVFCGILGGAGPPEHVASTDRVGSVRDHPPQAPLHVLVVPRAHHADVVALGSADPATLADLVVTAARVAADGGCTAGEHRLVFNTGASAGQTVHHAHGHVLAAPGASLDGHL